jgi:hypothetical protein
MSTVAETATARKPKAFYAQFHGLSGVITRPNQDVLFLESESGSVVTITQADEPHLDVHCVNPTPVYFGVGKVSNWGHCHGMCSYSAW